MSERISIREYARRLRIDEKAVRKAIAAGRICRGYDKEVKKILPDEANQEWGYKHEAVKQQKGVSRAKAIEKMGATPDLPPLETPETLEDLQQSLKINSRMPVAEALRFREIIGAGLDKMKLAEVEGRLVDREKVYKALFGFGNEIKKSLLNIPQRVARDIMAAANEVEVINILTDELTAVLTFYSNLNKDSF
jgi:hypothetical protein